jgi:hypothetical protein
MDADSAEEQYEIDVDLEQEWYDSALESERATYSTADANALSSWYVRIATDEHDTTALWISNETQHVQADIAAEDAYAHAADALLVTITSSRDSISNTYWEQAAGSWIAALAAFATANPSPWAQYELAKQTHFRDDYLASADSAQATLDGTEAQADASEFDTEADDTALSENTSEADWAAEETSDDDSTWASAAATAAQIAMHDAENFPSLAAIPPSATAGLPSLVTSFGLSTFSSFLSPSLGTVSPNPLGEAQQLANSVSVNLPDTGEQGGLVESPEDVAVEADLPELSSSESVDDTNAATEGAGYQAPLSGREIELVIKIGERLERGITISDLGAFGAGVLEGLWQGVNDGLPGMVVGAVKFAARATSFMIQLHPATRLASKLITGHDCGADEQAAVMKFGKDSWEIIKKSPEVAAKAVELAKEINQFIVGQEADFVKSLVDGSLDDYFESKIARLSPLAQEAISTARLIAVELAHAGLDNLDAKAFGKIVGQVIYEVVEDTVVTVVLGLVEGGTAGLATPIVGAAGGAEAAAKAAKVARIVNRLSKVPGFNMPMIVKGLERLQEVILWMHKYPICFVAGTPVHTQTGLRPIEQIREGDFVLSRNELSPSAAPEWRRVLSTVVTHPTRLYQVRFFIAGTKDFETVTGTGEHPFFVASRQAFVPLKELSRGEVLSLADGRIAVVAELDIQDAKSDETFTTYNFEVAENHTYFVGATGVWVHNAGNPCDRAFQIFTKAKNAGKDDAEALIKARTFIEKMPKIGSVERARHLKDLDDIMYREVIKDFNFGKHLEKMIGPPPKGMLNPHAHHILFKRGLGEAQKDLVREGQAILRKVGIDPIFGPEVLVWAPNGVEGQHGIDALQTVMRELRALDEAGADYDDFVEKLAELGKIAARRK